MTGENVTRERHGLNRLGDAPLGLALFPRRALKTWRFGCGRVRALQPSAF